MNLEKTKLKIIEKASNFYRSKLPIVVYIITVVLVIKLIIIIGRDISMFIGDNIYIISVLLFFYLTYKNEK